MRMNGNSPSFKTRRTVRREVFHLSATSCGLSNGSLSSARLGSACAAISVFLCCAVGLITKGGQPAQPANHLPGPCEGAVIAFGHGRRSEVSWFCARGWHGRGLAGGSQLCPSRELRLF